MFFWDPKLTKIALTELKTWSSSDQIENMGCALGDFRKQKQEWHIGNQNTFIS